MKRSHKIIAITAGVGIVAGTTYLLARAKPVKAGGAVAALQNTFKAVPFENQTGLVARFSNGLADLLNIGAGGSASGTVPPVIPPHDANDAVREQFYKDAYSWLFG